MSNKRVHPDDVLLVTALVVVLVLAILLVVLGASASAMVEVGCGENAYLVGQGDYDRGRWESVGCGPVIDDLVSASASANRYDVNMDGQINVLDVQLVVNAYLSGGGG